MASRVNFKKQRPKNAVTAGSYTPTRIQGRNKAALKNAPSRRLILLPGDQALSQDPTLRILRGQVGLNGDHPVRTNDIPMATASMPANVLRDDENEDLNVTVFNTSIAQKDGTTSRARSSREKKEEQAQNWLTKVIPSLLQPYMELLQKSESLRIAPTLKIDEGCSCARAHELKLTIIRFDSLDLVRSGLFPCAPYRPTLAVDIRMLDFVMRLFLRISPNHTAWCGALEEFLSAQGYRLVGTDPLRRRFSNALQWFISLQHATAEYVKDHITKTGRIQSHKDKPNEPSNENEGRDSTVRVDDYPQTMQGDGRDGVEVIPAVRHRESISLGKRKCIDQPSEELPQPARKNATATTPSTSTLYSPDNPRASEYLRSRCPLCFGGTSKPNSSDARKGPSVLVCVDACFTQKHNDQHGKDPRRIHPDTFFVSPEKVKEMEDWVESIRNSREKKRGKQRDSDDDEDDFMEPGMKVPKSALDGCNTSFTASDEGRSKSRAKGYDERALSGMFCPHGNSLFMVTMTSLGEKQHYILVLLKILFEHIPEEWTVGFLYDVACQLKRSCLKWDFLSEYLDRIVWGVSVFHAYGHQWPCQLIYHPRKCKGFGLCDGETCERCWHALSRLIAYTRVAGVYQYYVRLYTLDSQLHFNNQQALLNAGKWLQRKLHLCIRRQRDAKQEFDEAGKPLEFLREQWKLQVKSQTKPLPTQRKDAAKKAVEETLRLQKAVEVLKIRRRDLEEVLTSTGSASFERAMAVDDLENAKVSLQKAQEKLGRHERSLGLQERAQVKRLTKSPFLTKRMNARALKMRLRERLRARKFELDRLERSFRKQRSEQQLNEHTRDSIRRREPGISALATKYNKLCDEMTTLIRQKRAPNFAVAPKKIERDSLFDLDVDEDIWQDVGLDEEDTGPPPLWLCDENVRKGIRAMLELERCEEEMARIRINRKALQEWFVDEWGVLRKATSNTGNPGILYQLEVRRKYLLRLYVTWEKPLVEVSEGCSSEWGPSTEELAKARAEEIASSVEDQDVNVFDVDFEEGVDATLIAELDTLDVVDGFRGVVDE
ncbi:hypothetical protein K435DRAFT_819451 [Dendrothele bispora CBS 962.96]|uniref:CxC1-like cysteine cluster associated with KDZ transposases domain-containing protein n=1 Tax=Dendrothele bispora (strain CBS 962.96) TaxID=1314807 RepID=A0A4S8M2Q6_DENBC|nr:hypothetical protein K435DRAFT_819451 [Dendrothele bispora CBS 962.96]